MSCRNARSQGMCPFLRSTHEIKSNHPVTACKNICYLQRRPTRTNLFHTLHTQASLCLSPDHVVCPHYRIASHTHLVIAPRITPRAVVPRATARAHRSPRQVQTRTR